MWLRTLLLLVLIALIIRAVRRLLRGVMEGASSGGGGARSHQHTAVKMVADPVCGTFVIPGKALQLAKGRETVYFCSEKCRDQWVHAH